MKKIWISILAVLMVVVFCIACAAPAAAPSDTPAAADKPAAAEENTATAEQPAEKPADGSLDTITMVFPRSFECLDDAHIHAALEMGYFEEEGIDLKIEQAYGLDDLTMIVSGQANTGYPSSFVQIAGHEQGLPFKSVYQVDNVNIFGYCVRPDSGIKSIADLKGKTIALGDAAWNTISDPILIAAGVDPSEVEYITAGESRAQMVDSGQADAVLTWYKEFEMWDGQGISLEWLAGEDVLQLTGGCLVFENNFIEQNKDLIARFVRAYAKGAYFTYLNPAAATEITLDKFPSIEIEFPYALASIQSLVYIDNGKDVDEHGYGWHNADKWETQMDACRKGGTLTRTDLTLDEIYTNDFVEAANDFDHAQVESDAAGYQLKSENQQYAATNPPRS
ncbi:MAG: ABC transporter substrate-binding protein [Christensenella sp.]|uniref:ABC transporter substrate-binding protein n=1 Tax=Christensenella sp. TaxID=1935934 RepID=UPI002B20265A|nr:ABC transporter substrate-binding protein [Christensenella sp.]MEA5003471.1 ABC transporter substrate-binding protein [Christensenella sp.]